MNLARPYCVPVRSKYELIDCARSSRQEGSGPPEGGLIAMAHSRAAELTGQAAHVLHSRCWKTASKPSTTN